MVQYRCSLIALALLFGCKNNSNSGDNSYMDAHVDSPTYDADNGRPHGHFFDISDSSQGIPEGPLGFRPQSSVLDSSNGRVFVVGDSPGHSEQLELNCRKIDGTPCTTGAFSLLCTDSVACGYTPSAAIDDTFSPTNRKLVVASDANEGLRITRCPIDSSQPIDATHCLHAAAMAQDAGSIISSTPAIAIDRVGKTLLVATASTSLSLLRCALDGSNCIRATATTTTRTLAFPQIAIDTDQNNAVVAYYDTTSVAGALNILTCPLATTGFGTCAVQTLDGTANSGLWPSIAYNSSGKAILVAAEDDATNQTPSFYRCVFTGTTNPYACTKVDLSSLAGPGAGYTPWITSTSNEILMTTMNTNVSFYPWLFRCSLDGTNCTAQNWAGDNAPVDDSGYFPIALPNMLQANELYIVSHWLNQASTRVYVPTMVVGAL